jgi:colanic acid/amylovoran biosynthesis glycosyltransferase
MKRPRVCILCPGEPSPTETFIRAHIERLPLDPVAVIGSWRPSVQGRAVLSRLDLLRHKLIRLTRLGGIEHQTTDAYTRVFRRYNAIVALAEYGDLAVHAVAACDRVNIPLIAHFHGYDASRRDVLQQNAAGYEKLFRHAAGIVAVSHSMRDQLIELGAPAEKVHYNPYGVDCNYFSGSKPAGSAPILLAVGRFTEKKAPHLTLRAFARTLLHVPHARLRMIGDGPLRASCISLAGELGIDHAVAFLGTQGPAVVEEEMRIARAFVQHSLKAPSGDSEGTPVAILEAAASGLAVISTRHGGIPDVVIEGETGFLVNEGDVEGMSLFMTRVLDDPDLAGRFGESGRCRVQREFSMDMRIGHLADIIEGCVREFRVKTMAVST